MGKILSEPAPAEKTRLKTCFHDWMSQSVKSLSVNVRRSDF